jgi:hypothetical protein
MKKITVFSLLFFFLPNFTQAGAPGAWDALVRSRGAVPSYPLAVQELLKDDLYFTAIPYLKEYLSSNRKRTSKGVDSLIDRVVTQVGVRQFEVLPNSILGRTNASTIQYILAKKLFRSGQYQKALQKLNGTIERSHPAKPFALQLEGSIFALMGKEKSAVAAFKNCIAESKKQMNSASSENRLRQLAINRDYCIVGIPRAEFAERSFSDASLSYLELSKDSYVWPEILFEEAWNSFYLKDYNRTLGKLVTYKELCLFDDARNVVDGFYEHYQDKSLGVKRFLKKYGKNYKYFYLLAKSKRDGKQGGNSLLNQLLDSVLKDAAFLELVESFNIGRDEIEKVKGLKNPRMRKVFIANLRESLLLQRDLIGAYVRKSLHLAMDQLDKSFEGMTYIKLEVLGRAKQKLYFDSSAGNRSRGDIRYINRNEKQYFWTFNGEFWADELGDYVFSLRSECGQ